MDVHDRHEVFEMEVLDRMRRIKVLEQLVFGGGTMLRLCFELPRYSVDLDFRMRPGQSSFAGWDKKMRGMLADFGAEITDAQHKHFSYLYEIRKAGFPRRLKIEIRKESLRGAEMQENIAFSRHSSLQVRLLTFSLRQMWRNKINALLDRKIIRDAYDLEFLTRRGAGEFAALGTGKLENLLKIVEQFSTEQYRSVLGVVLPAEERAMYREYRFDYLKSTIKGLLS